MIKQIGSSKCSSNATKLQTLYVSTVYHCYSLRIPVSAHPGQCALLNIFTVGPDENCCKNNILIFCIRTALRVSTKEKKPKYYITVGPYHMPPKISYWQKLRQSAMLKPFARWAQGAAVRRAGCWQRRARETTAAPMAPSAICFSAEAKSQHQRCCEQTCSNALLTETSSR